MKTLIFVLLILFSSGCAHAYLESMNEKEIVVCGNRFSGQEDMENQAKQVCNGTPVMVGFYMKDVATIFYNNAAIPKRAKCERFRCD